MENSTTLTLVRPCEISFISNTSKDTALCAFMRIICMQTRITQKDGPGLPRKGAKDLTVLGVFSVTLFASIRPSPHQTHPMGTLNRPKPNPFSELGLMRSSFHLDLCLEKRVLVHIDLVQVNKQTCTRKTILQTLVLRCY